MTEPEALEDALAVALEAHRGQMYGDLPYIFHPIEVAMMVRQLGGDIDQQVAAILHDVVEDSDVTVTAVETRFGTRTAQLVTLLTRPDGMTYQDYVERLESHPEAALVKLADSYRNFANLALMPPGEKRDRLARKYLANIRRLLSAEGLVTAVDWVSWSLGQAAPFTGPVLGPVDEPY